MSLLAMLLVTSGGFPVAQAVFHGAPMIPVSVRNASVQSSNWGGYAVTGASGSVTAALASWTVPSATCGSAETSYSSFWVGIDGFSSSTVEQTGTDSDCSNGVATYYAWYEFYPKPSRGIGSISVHPGDEIGAVVVYSAKTGLFTDAIRDFTTGQQFSTSSAVSGAQRSSAEFILESPALCGLLKCHLASLANFGTVAFGQDNTGLTLRINCAAQINGVTGSIGSFGSAVQQITMVSQSNPTVVKASPSALSNDGTSFTAAWMNAGP
jgi:Peptidase A4 family